MAKSLNLAGSDIGRYRLVKLIGAGGMGEVYDAIDSSLGRHVALKILKSDAVSDPKRLARFVQEARSASALNHPHLVSIYEIGTHANVHFIAMEKVDGSTLRKIFSSERVPIERALELMVQITEAVAAAHGAGIVHRDLKPENIMVATSGYVKVLDFGLAKLHPETDLLTDSSASTLFKATDSGILLGTVGYMSPEQAQGKPADNRSDIFSLGCILYEALTGKRAFYAASSIDTLHQTVHDEPAPLHEIAPEASPELQRIVRKALAKDLEERYQSAKEMAIDLRDAARTSVVVGRRNRKKTAASVAVLPFENATRDPQNDYLVDGITESLIHRISEFPGLRVMARSTVFHFREKQIEPLQAGRQFGVGMIISGRVTIHGRRLSIDAELIDTRDGARLWGERFDRDLPGIQDADEDIASAISEHLRIKLSPSQKRRLTRRHEIDPAAYRLYLQGRFWWNKRPQEGFMRGLDYFQQAIERDPLFALAYSGIADAYAILGSWEAGLMPPHDAMPRAKAAAKRAIELDDHLADPYASLGYILLHYDWNWEDSSEAFTRAIELNPNCVNAHHWISHLHTARRNPEQSLDESRKTADLDPLDLIANVHLAWHYWLAREPERVIEQSRKTATLEPNSFWPLFFEGLGYELQSDLDSAEEKFRQARDRVPTSTFPAAALAHVLARKGAHDEALAVLDDFDRMAVSRYVPAYDRAIVYIGTGDIDRAFEWLDRTFDERSGWLAYLQVEPRLDPIRSDPRFSKLCERVGLR
jgi:serine/threonine protein kinase/tetratricopeptide (TPR) repeat protein